MCELLFCTWHSYTDWCARLINVFAFIRDRCSCICFHLISLFLSTNFSQYFAVIRLPFLLFAISLVKMKKVIIVERYLTLPFNYNWLSQAVN